jgi:hypothetical protein
MTEIESIFRAIGPSAVIAGTVLVVFQVRVHAKNVRSRNAFDLIAKLQLDWFRSQSAGLRGEELRERL